MAKQRFSSAETDKKYMTQLKAFEQHLEFENKSPHTVRAYLFTLRQFYELYPALNSENLLLYKCYLIDHYKAQTVNLRIRAINAYSEFINSSYPKMLMVRHSRKSFLENVISQADYEYLKNRLFQDEEMTYYFAVWIMAATGLRISELLKLQVEDIRRGFINISSKGNRFRRVYIPQTLCQSCMKWLKESNRTKGSVFLNRSGNPITPSGIRSQLQHFASVYNLNPSVVHPHSFRHLFAKNFIDQCNDIAMLSDILGHQSIATTRIYLQRSSTEQQVLFNQIVDW